jgi:gliding motility-associated-like protein
MNIAATQKSLLALLLSLCLHVVSLAQHISCTDAHVISDKSTQIIPSVSDYNLPESGLIGCFSDTLHQSYWFKFTALTSGTFKFAATSSGLAADYDFVLFSEACPCDATASKIVACNWIGAVTNPPYVPTGISDNPSADFGITDPMAPIEFEKTVNLQVGKNYYLILDNITNNGVGFKIEFGGTAQIGAPVIEPAPKLGKIIGKTEVCSGTPALFEAAADPRLTDFEWKVPTGAKVTGSGSKVLITFGNQGGKIRLIGKNSCQADTAYIDVKVNTAPDLTLKEPAYFCKNTCFDTKDVKFLDKNNLTNTTFQFYNKKEDAYIGSLSNLAPSVICQAQTLYLRATSDKNCFDTLHVKITEEANPSVVLIGGGVVCFGDTVMLSFSFTGKAPYNVTYSDGTQDWSFSTNKDIIDKKTVINSTQKIYVKTFSESSNLCKTRVIGDAEFFPSLNCKCLKKAGSMNSVPVEVCANEKASAKHNNDHIKGTNDKLIFILHNVASPDLATIFAMSDTPNFSFMSGLMYEVPYYVSAVVGSTKSNGEVDLADPCLGISAGVPIVFHKAPDAKLTGDTLICANEITDITLTPIGKAPFEVTYGNAQGNTILNIDKKTTFKESLGIFYIKKIKDALGCTNTYTDTVSIRVPKKMEVQSQTYVCNANNTNYQVVLELSGGEANTYKALDKKGVFVKNKYTSVVIPNGQAFNFKFTDANGCDTLLVADKHTCSCGAKSDPATLNLVPITICESLAATASFMPDQKLVGTDLQGFILHDGTDKSIGKVLAYNGVLPQFSKQTGMITGKIYYITSVAGDADSNGKVDLLSPCTVFGKVNVPITFVQEPSVGISGTKEVCENTAADLVFQFSGSPLFDVVYNDGQKNISILNIPTLSHPIQVKNSGQTTYKLVSVKTSGVPGCKGNVVANQAELQITSLPALETKNVKVECSADKKTYQVSFDINGGKSGTYTINAKAINNASFTSLALTDGTPYNFTVESAANCKPILVSGVGYCNCPPNAALKIETLSPIQCHNDKNAALTAKISNVKAPYSFVWSNGDTKESIQNLSAGTYTVTITNQENCLLIDSITIKNPSEIRSSFEVQDVRCFGEKSGVINFELTEGGTAPYLYSIDNQNFSKENIFSKLKSQRYELRIKDARNCLWEGLAEVAQPEEFYVSLGENQILKLGQETQLEAIVSAPYEKITWSDPSLKGLNPSLLLLKSQQYILTATDKKGCQAKDSVWIYVGSEREVFAPNSFSPNGDGINDSFTIFAGSDVSKINTLEVTDRWGNLIYQVENIKANDELMGWQGSFKGHLANQDTYIYKAVVEFLDGKLKTFSGEVLLIR